MPALQWLEPGSAAGWPCASRGPACSALQVFGKIRGVDSHGGESRLVTEPTFLQKLAPSHRGADHRDPFLVMDATLP